MRPTGWLFVFAVVLALVPATAAAFGGFDFLTYERHYYVPGELARGSTRLVDPGWTEKDGPFYGYLLPDGTTFEPPIIPEAAVPLGAVLAVDPVPNGELYDARASLEFTVPKVPPGAYEVVLCNLPCRKDLAGTLLGGRISVVATAEEAKLMNFGVKLERRLERRMEEWLGAYEGGLSAVRNQAFGLNGQLSDLIVQVGRGRAVDDELMSRLNQADAQLVEMERRITDLADGMGWPSRPLHWVVLTSGWLAALAVASLWVRSALGAPRPSPSSEEHSVDLDEVTPMGTLPVSAGDWWPRTEQAASMTAASRRAMSLAGNGRRQGDA